MKLNPVSAFSFNALWSGKVEVDSARTSQPIHPLSPLNAYIQNVSSCVNLNPVSASSFNCLMVGDIGG